jgi:hypothetical protein
MKIYDYKPFVNYGLVNMREHAPKTHPVLAWLLGDTRPTKLEAGLGIVAMIAVVAWFIYGVTA